VRLNAVEARVVGSLIEKELATPQQYPLTLNALVMACNQSSNREPVVQYDEATVEAALTGLREQRLVRFVHPSHGRSVLRYRLVLDEVLGLDERQRALLAVLLLRGPQTLGELRIRTERLASFEGLEDVEGELARFGRMEDPLVERLDRRPGQKEDRYSQRLVSEHERAGSAGAGTPGPNLEVEAETTVSPAREQAPTHTEPRRSAIDELQGRVAKLETDLVALRSDFDDLRNNLGG
jgi:uncharacterized protein